MFALFVPVVEKMSRLSVSRIDPSFVFSRKACLYITDTETKLGSEIQKLLHVFLFHFHQMLISPSLQRSVVITKIIYWLSYDTDLLIILVAVLLDLFISIYFI